MIGAVARRTWRWSALDRRQRAGVVASGVMIAAAAAMAVQPVTAGAAYRDAQGWWWRAQTELIYLDPPPHVPPGGVAVGQSLDGATAVTAVRFQLDDDETNPILHLRVAQDFGGATAVMAACRAGSSWTPDQAGLWTAKPKVACNLGSVNGSRSEDGTTWSFPVQSLLLDELLDIVIVPSAESPPFELSFEPVGSDDLETSEAVDERPFTPPPPPPTFGSVDDGGFGDVAPPPEPVQAFEPAVPEEDQAVEPDAPVASAQRETFGRDFFGTEAVSGQADPRRLGILVLVAAATAVFMMSGEQLRPARALGPMAHRHPELAAAGAEPRGVGRFTRVRAGDDPRLF